MNSIFRRECTFRIRSDDLLQKIPGGESYIIAAGFWENTGEQPISHIVVIAMHYRLMGGA